MLSDVLAEALDDIVYYQKTYPAIYDPHASEIRRIKRLMRGLLAELDTPPEESRHRTRKQPHDNYHGEERDPLRPSTFQE
jgi:hypothetical protein